MKHGWLLAVMLLGAGSVQAGQFQPPRPEVFARPEDQVRARLLNTPCTSADLGRGCYRYDNRLIREYPCSFAIDAGVRGSLPVDQCYKMEQPRRYRGTWIDEFEGQRFISEGTTPPEWPHTDPRSSGWREQAERARAARIWLDVDRAGVRHDFGRGRRLRIEFVGCQTLYPGAYGHMGMSGSEIIVDRMISMEEVR
jgi:hypothetical protein